MLRGNSIRRAGALGQQRRLRAIDKCQFVVLPQFMDANGGKLNLGHGGPDLDAQQGSAAGADTNDPTYVGERGLRLPGIVANQGFVADSAALRITGDIDIRGRIYQDVMPPATAEMIMEKTGIGGNAGWGIYLKEAASGIQFFHSANGTDIVEWTTSSPDTPNSVLGVTAGNYFLFKITLDVDDGAGGNVLKYWFAPDGDLDDATWTQAGGTQQLGVGTTSIYASTGDVHIGMTRTDGALYNGGAGRLQIRDGIDGTVVFDADFTKVAGGATSFTEDSSNGATVTINQDGLDVARIIDGPTDVLDGTDDYFEVANETKWTNLLTNPSFETNTTGWVTDGTNTIAQSAEQAHSGANSLKWTFADNSTIARYGSLVLTDADHTFSMWVYIPSGYDGGVRLTYSAYASASGDALVDANTGLVDQWQRLDLTMNPDAGDLSGNLVINTAGSDPTAGKFVYIDAVQVELGSTANPYVDGSLPLGRWTGTAHASTSESRSNLDYLIDSSGVSISAVRSYDVNHGGAANQQLLTKSTGAGAEVGHKMFFALSGAIRGRVADGAANPGDDNAGTADGQMLVAATVRDVAADDVETFIDGVGTGSPVTDSTTATIANDEVTRIGSLSDGTQPLAGEHFGSAFRNTHDAPAPTDKEVEMASRQLARATGRWI